MGKKIMVDPAKLKSASSAIDEVVADYKSIYTQLFSDVDGLAASWQGADNTAFTNQIHGFKDDFDNMAALMSEYARYLSVSAAAYETAQQDIVQAAGKLTN